MTLEEKEKIDYEIKAKKEAKDKELAEWTFALYVVLIIIVLGILLLSTVY